MSTVRRLASRFGRGARRLHDDEEGAAMVFAAITLFSLALATFMVFQVGMVSTDRMQIQTAADAAAYSGAQVEANAINAIGQINDGMTYVHYATLRYVLDNIVYGTLNAFRTHPQWLRQNDRKRLLSQRPTSAASGGLPTEFGGGIENKPAPDWVMLGDEAEWRKRWGAVERSGRRAVEEGKRWLQELDAANHLILQKTPEMVREKAAEVAFLNGASHMAISSDLEQAWRSNEDGRDEVGFIDAKGEGSNVASSLAFRYGTRKLSVDGGRTRELSNVSWFDPLAGKSRPPGYSQVRVCWNKNDWAHRSNREQHADPQLSSTWSRSPNGHWHCKHRHAWLDESSGYPVYMSQDHGGLMGNVQEAPTTSGGFGGGHMFPQDDDPQLHLYAQEGGAQGVDPIGMEPHHATVYCPTCMSQDSDSVRNAQFSQVKKTQERADARRLALELKFDSSPPRPLQIAQPLLRSGVTVAAWRDSHGIGDLLPKSEWGMIALAAAQIGLMDQQGRVFALESITSGQKASYGPGGEVPLDRLNEGPYRNLFYSHDDSKHPGMRFGARLVPLRREETHHPKLHRSGAIGELLQAGGGGRWWTTSNPAQPAPSNMSQEAPPSLGALRQWIVFDDFRRAQEVLWH